MALPSITGIIRSRRMRLGFWETASSRPICPFSAVRTSKPEFDSLNAKASDSIFSSSTMRTFFFEAVSVGAGESVICLLPLKILILSSMPIRLMIAKLDI